MKSLTKVVLIATTVAAAASVQAAAGPVSGQGTWETTLQARDLDGDGAADAFYDTVLNISWLADANVAGKMTFDQATSWATGLSVAGISGWHLPTIHAEGCKSTDFGATFTAGGGINTCGYDVDPTTSDMAFMHLVTLANPSSANTFDPTLENTGPFSNLMSYGYWFSMDHAVGPWNGITDYDQAFRYSFHAGRQDNVPKSFPLYAWAVHDGDVGQPSNEVVAAVPEPQTYALMLTGLALVVPVARRRRATSAMQP